MKRLLTILGMICALSSCIYDSVNDNFYRTLWVSEEPPFSEASRSADGRITIEFLCGGSISVTATCAAGSYGTYQTYGNTAYFVGLTLSYYGDAATIIATYRETEEYGTAIVEDDVVSGNDNPVSEYRETSGDSDGYNAKSSSGNESTTIIIEEAHRTGDILLVSWHREGSPTPYSTRFIRRSSYE